MKEKTIPETGVTRQEQDLATREPDRFLVPPVDIYETPEGLTVVADMPGVTKEDLDLQVEHDVLTIRGRISRKLPDNLAWQEYDLAGAYFRQFQLDDKVDRERIGAELRHGVLTLRLPKVEQARPRRIDVQVK